MASMMDEMQKTLARRRALTEKKEVSSVEGKRDVGVNCIISFSLNPAQWTMVQRDENRGKSRTRCRTSRIISTRTEGRMVREAMAMATMGDLSRRGHRENASEVPVRRLF